MDHDKMIDGRTGEELGPEVDLTYARNQFSADFMGFVDHKITCCKVGGGSCFKWH